MHKEAPPVSVEKMDINGLLPIWQRRVWRASGKEVQCKRAWVRVCSWGRVEDGSCG